MSSKTLPPKQRTAIGALVSGHNYAISAKLAGVTVRQLHRWLKHDAFKAELDRAQTAVINTASRRLSSLASKAVDSLEEILDNPTQRGATNKRLAAVAILDQAGKLRTLSREEEQEQEEDKKWVIRFVDDRKKEELPQAIRTITDMARNYQARKVVENSRVEVLE